MIKAENTGQSQIVKGPHRPVRKSKYPENDKKTTQVYICVCMCEKNTATEQTVYNISPKYFQVCL